VTSRTGAAALVASLAAHGVDTVFGIPGTHNLPIYAELAAQRVRHISPRHEQGAGFAADGYARVSGTPGVVVATTGPAILNAATAAAQSYSDSIPVLLISPGMPTDHPARGNGYLHEVKDQRAAMAAITAGSDRVSTVAEIPAAVAAAFADLTSGRPRPRHLEIPLDLLDRAEEVTIQSPLRTSNPTPDVTDAVRAVASANRIGIIAGGGARGAAPQLRALAERLAAPVVTTANGKAVLPEDHPLSFGAGVHHPSVARFLAACDVVLAIGTELAPADCWYGPLPLPRLIRIDIEPAAALANAVPDVAVIGDAATAIDALLDGLAQREPEPWWAELQQAVRSEAATEGERWLPLLGALHDALGRDGILTADSAMVCYYGALSNLPRYQPSSFLYPTGLGTLGYGLPAAIGASLAARGRRVAVLHGDGGFLFTAPELASAAQLGLPLPVVVVDNGGYGEIRAEMLDRGDPVHAVDLPETDFAALGVALGCHGVRVDKPDELPGIVDRAFTADRPTVIHVRQD
jgi:acetolactate synthase-1/2/3 large subunit